MITLKIAGGAFETETGHVTAPSTPELRVVPSVEVLEEPTARIVEAQSSR